MQRGRGAMVASIGQGAAHSSEVGTKDRETLGLWDAVSIIIGIVIGAGIYETAPLVLSNVRTPAEALALWALGGVLSLIGATCYAELASTYPRSGGDYVYLSRAFAPAVGFLFGWAQLAVLLTGSIAMMAYVFADYATALWGADESVATGLAAAAVVVLTAINASSVSVGKNAQNVLSLLKLFGILGLVVTGFLWQAPAQTRTTPVSTTEGSSFGLALVLVLYTFGGWNDAAFIAAEVRNKRRTVPRALVIGTAAVTIVYLLVNAAFIAGLGFEGARASKAIAADLLQRPFGVPGAAIMSSIVMMTALGAANALVLTGARVYASMGADYSTFAGLGRWHPRLHSPLGALVAQLAVTLVLIGTVGTSIGRRVTDRALVGMGFMPAEWSGHGGFDTLLRCTAPIFWFFFLLSGLSLFVLRKRDPERRRPFRVPLYPLVPLIFCSTCAYMLYSAIIYAGRLTIVGAIPVLFGIPVYFASKRRPTSISQRAPSASGAE